MLTALEVMRLPQGEQCREDLCQLIAAHGFDPNEVGAVDFSVVDAPVFTVRIFERNEEGRRYLGPDGEVAQHEVDVLLRQPPPAWWPGGRQPSGV